jgi:hypothetical protein
MMAGGRWYHAPMLLVSGEVKLIFLALRERELYIDYEAFKQ